MIVRPGHPGCLLAGLGYEFAGNPIPPAGMDWTWVPPRRNRKCRGKPAGVAWNVNFNNGNCNTNNVNNNNYVRAVRSGKSSSAL
ncbi:MAG: hypothetical protein DKINENOH_04558 [bacterium]|nr:hypothetical protein [bacterium]